MKGVGYNQSKNLLEIFFIYDERIDDELATLKPKLETDFKESVKFHTKEDIKFKFSYEKSYVDTTLLAMKVAKYLRAEYSVLSRTLKDEDVTAQESGGIYNVNLFVPRMMVEYLKRHKVFMDFQKSLRQDYFAEFNFFINEKEGDFEISMPEDIPTEYERVDKSMKVKNIEYFLGRPIRMRPIKIEFLKVSVDDQVIAGKMLFITKREYTKKTGDDVKGGEEGEVKEEKKAFFTFVIDDGKNRVNCVYFPTQKSLSQFEKLTNDTVVAAIGAHQERNGRLGFRVGGISFCELAD